MEEADFLQVLILKFGPVNGKTSLEEVAPANVCLALDEGVEWFREGVNVEGGGR